MNYQGLNILVWNVHGSGSSQFLHILKELIQKYSLKIFVSVERKLSGIIVGAICNKLQFDDRFQVEANGFAGGIWVLWHKEEIQVTIVSSSDQYVTCFKFDHWIENKGLPNLGFSGHPFTCSRGHNPTTQKLAYLDRALCNQQWRVHFEEVGVRHLLQNNPDHCSVLISPNGSMPIQNIHLVFHCHATLLTHKNFEEYHLRSNCEHTTPMYPLLGKVAQTLDDRNKTIFGNIHYNIAAV
ncbi:hypothetical protein Cgig2_017739 [Carnegiea gigantea]|uniref:Uncharacterized protein n=1 Tax=Carnegiea gigantea TaxID=171969 RepID=A0A9Q1JL86_9CARY|nr:hypothetical protein Cgig2_017739 [Carnegiea gigantea]